MFFFQFCPKASLPKCLLLMISFVTEFNLFYHDFTAMYYRNSHHYAPGLTINSSTHFKNSVPNDKPANTIIKVTRHTLMYAVGASGLTFHGANFKKNSESVSQCLTLSKVQTVHLSVEICMQRQVQIFLWLWNASYMQHLSQYFRVPAVHNYTPCYMINLCYALYKYV